jgi:5-formyltetrahydrofolate cyclo-ligase
VTEDPREQKSALRDGMRRFRAGIPPEERVRLAQLIEDRLLSLSEAKTARTVLLFYSFGSEVATGGMAEHLLAEGKRLLLPYLGPDGMEAAEVLAGDPLLITEYGPREPSHRTPVDPGEVDMVITPGLAFDRRGFRLGYGGGYYDRYLTRLRPETTRVGIGFSIQLIDRIPEEPLDQRVHFVVTDGELVDCRRAPGGGRKP